MINSKTEKAFAITKERMKKMIAIVDKVRCSGCGDCMMVCPVDAITMALGKAEVDPDECIGCGACVDECRRGAISMRD